MSQNITTRTHSNNKSRVWTYFKQCDDDPNRVKCNLCSIELCNRGTTTILWNHVKFKHSIDKTMSNHDTKHQQLSQDTSSAESTMTPLKLRNNTDLRKNLDFIDYNDFSLTSMKPLPSTSLSKNLISRLNQLSSPITRKLKFWNKRSFQVNQYDPSFKVIYLGNLGMQLWSKDESCLDKPLSTLWNNYLVNMKTEIVMRLTICNSGLKAITRQHGLTQYWSNRHEGKKMRQELRCHAVFCPSPEKAAKMVTMLNQRLACALQEFRREKKSRGFSIMSNTSSTQQTHLQPRTVPLRRQILAKGSANFRPPLERSKSAPKLTSILEEDYDLDDQSQDEFEFEDSFDERDEGSDYDGDDGVEYTGSGKEDEDSTHKIESNSSAITVNEETSNSSVCATGDRSNDKNYGIKGQSIYETTPLNGTLVVSPYQINRTVSACAVHQQLKSNDNFEPSQPNTKATFEYSSSPTNNIADSQNQEFQRSSANIKTSSSFKQSMVANNQDINSVKDQSSLIMSEAKNNNTTSNKREPQPTDDVTTQDILLSWSNLVIK